MLDWILLIIGFTMITVGATWLTNGSAAVAKKLKISEFIIGMTIVAVGTSLPELTVSIASTFNGSADMAIGNVVGSNLFNILFILGLCALIKPVTFTRNNLRVDILLCLVVSAALVVMLWGGTLSRIEAIILLLSYVAVIMLSIKTGKSEQEDTEEDENSDSEKFSWVKTAFWIILGFAGLVYGADITLNSATAIARSFGISERVIAITLLAGGTSLPELAASIAAVLKGHGSLALGNVIGSNIANILLILGLSATINPLTMGGITPRDLLMVLLSAVLIFVSAFTFRRHELDRTEGILFLAIYAGYIYLLVA